MKPLRLTLFLLTILLNSQNGLGQLISLSTKKIDYSTLKDRTLYIQETSDINPKKLSTKSPLRIVHKEFNSKLLLSAIGKSSYDITKVEISKSYSTTNQEKAIFLTTSSKGYNSYIHLSVTHPKYKRLVTKEINHLSLNIESDLTLLINLLTNELKNKIELYNEGKRFSDTALRKKEEEKLSKFYANIKDKTLLVPKVYYNSKEKTKRANLKLEKALKEWTLSKAKLCTIAEINQLRALKSPDYYYIKTFVSHSQPNPSIPNSRSVSVYLHKLLTTESDYILFMDDDFHFTGLYSKELKPEKIITIHTKLSKKVRKYK